MGFKHIYTLNRTDSKAIAAADHLGENVSAIRYQELPEMVNRVDAMATLPPAKRQS
ncbi:hypothetical protein [Lentilactobacillus kisonensis]|uniref:hypothetical protein n=1 Tax=Lentilactobacillus kisonensis TaxID=481722 RepID=UPI000ABE9C8F